MQFTGKIGELVDISGNNFSRISRVLFSDAPSNFKIVNDNLIQARVPENAAWDYIKIISDERSVTGTSSQKFCPEPLIQDYYLTSGIYGDTISITGQAFSGLLSGSLNGLSVKITADTNYYATGVVPSGDARGNLIVYGQSGLSNTSKLKFSPQVLVTGFYPTSGIPGDPINIYGKYFFDELMYTGDQTGKYLVSYGSNRYSGYVEKISDTHLSGKIPNSLIDGGISVARNDSVLGGELYYERSSLSYDVLALGNPEILCGAGTLTGFYSSYYGNQPITFGTKNIGTDKNGKGLYLGLINSTQTGAFMSGTSGLLEITEASYASAGSAFLYIQDGAESDQSKNNAEAYGGVGEFVFYEDGYNPDAGVDINPAFNVPSFTANPETADTESFQALASPTEAAIIPGDYYIVSLQNQLAAYGTTGSRAMGNQKVKILPRIANRPTPYGSSFSIFSQTAGSSTQTINGQQHVVNHNSAGVAISTGIHKVAGIKNLTVTPLMRNYGLGTV